MFWIIVFPMIWSGLFQASESMVGGNRDPARYRSAYSECQNLPEASDVDVLIDGQVCHVAVDVLGARVCYGHWFRTRQCCERCMSVRNANKPHCHYGDRDAACQSLQPSMCYVAENRRICCDTCDRIADNNRPDCRYGDLSVMCNRLQRFQCYIPENKRICCSKCATFADVTKPECLYGDRSLQCRVLSPSHCYTRQNQRTCCATCSAFRTGPGDCPYGDRTPECQGIPRGACYNPETRNTCCLTCRNYYTGVSGCEYGNRHVLWNTPSGRLDCENQIRINGIQACQETSVRQSCCWSCRGYMERPGQNSYTANLRPRRLQ